jgi:hypothetical protein
MQRRRSPPRLNKIAPLASKKSEKQSADAILDTSLSNKSGIHTIAKEIK